MTRAIWTGWFAQVWNQCWWQKRQWLWSSLFWGLQSRSGKIMGSSTKRKCENFRYSTMRTCTRLYLKMKLVSLRNRYLEYWPWTLFIFLILFFPNILKMKSKALGILYHWILPSSARMARTGRWKCICPSRLDGHVPRCRYTFWGSRRQDMHQCAQHVAHLYWP